ncbi:dihydrolipoyl dehydrogenase [Virgibacillus phasianinus]|uniref:Dihydrolipoyl dehydrogenase n=1 Tax=Virgibacillus phasianinus TaxID=2017483 RepID=A0A220U395_9BACI|nr:dihydrolipoyl dehydrogenase [Virgibacillus phasianinus]ASK62628.1 dihydrolipoyl dehydrogenase [Virgibacillus phasianinus]
MVVGEFAEKRDVVIIGGGPGGYNAAIRAAQLGKSVTLIEKASLGGVCLNQGCVPSKVFAHAAKQLARVPAMNKMGIVTAEPHVDFDALMSYKDKTVKQLRSGVESLCKANKIELITGEANFTGENKIGVANGHQFDIYEFEYALIATGSSTIVPDGVQPADECILHPETIYQMTAIPESLLIYGSDYIALEAAFSFKKLGSDVAIVLNDRSDFPFDASINRELKRILKKEKIKVYRNYQLERVNSADKEITINLLKNGEKEKLTGSRLYMSAERQANIQELGIERIGVKQTNKGFIQTDHTMKTSVRNIFAAGDVTDGAPSAVQAIKQGKTAAETICGMNSEVDLTHIPTVVHSNPPIATVGLTEKKAADQGYSVKISQSQLSGNSYAMISGEKSGIVTVIKDSETDLLLGIHIIGAGAIELISTGVTALEMVAREEDLRFPSYPHPSMNEGLMEALDGLSDMAIHAPPKKGK